MSDHNCRVYALYTGRSSRSFATLAVLLMLHTHNNTDSYKLGIFFGIALYCGGNYVVNHILIDFMCSFPYFWEAHIEPTQVRTIQTATNLGYFSV